VTSAAPTTATPPEPLRVLTYNVKHLTMDRAAVVRVLREVRPDVVALQEPPRGVFRGRLRRVAAAAGYRVALRGRGARTTAFLVRADAVLGDLRTRTVRLPVRGPRSRRARPILRGVAVLGIGGLTVVDVHLSLDTAERARHVAALRRLVASGPLGDGAGPGRVVLVGDLNEAPTDASWRALRALLSDALDLLPRPAGPEPLTFPAHDPRLRLDGVLVGRDVAVHDVAAIDTAEARRASDHLPVVVSVAVRPPHR